MGDIKGFLKVKRQAGECRAVCERVKDFKDIVRPKPDLHSQEQASRCMDCGTPFCHWQCPIGNYIPEWNDYMFHGNWKMAFELLNATNNMPEITGRLCPALCEYSCVLGINDDAVTIRENELAIVEHAFKKGLIRPNPPKDRTGKKIAVVGSGPAGLCAAAGLNKAGHEVIIFERDKQPGGILRYGIPDFKLEKNLLERRIGIWEEEGIKFITGVEIGNNCHAKELLKDFDAIALTGGCRVPRDLKIEGRDLKGIHFAMDYLTQANKRISQEEIPASGLIDVKGKKVVVIGGGDTGADCVGTAHRQGASCVVQIEVMPKPAEYRSEDYPWPKYPLILKTSTSHEEGGERHWSIITKEFIGEKGHIKKLKCERAKEVSGTEFDIDADLVIIAVGFLHPQHKGMLSELDIALDKGNVRTDDNYMTSINNVFSAGDMRRGQSLIVWAISEGRRCAYAMDKYLMGRSYLPLI